MTADLLALLDRLEAVHAAATPGPWRLDKGGDYHQPWWHIPDIARGRYGPNAIDVGQDEATGAAIVAEHNAIPALCAAVRAALALADEWERGATRWANPLPIPPEVEQLRECLRTALSSALPDTTKD